MTSFMSHFKRQTQTATLAWISLSFAYVGAQNDKPPNNPNTDFYLAQLTSSLHSPLR